MIYSKFITCAIAMVVVLSACSGGRRGSVHPASGNPEGSIVFHSYADRGEVEASFSSGTHCKGTFNTVPQQLLWGNNRSFSDVETVQAGMALLACSNARVLRCNFVRDRARSGRGTCKDNVGESYELYF